MAALTVIAKLTKGKTAITIDEQSTTTGVKMPQISTKPKSSHAKASRVCVCVFVCRVPSLLKLLRNAYEHARVCEMGARRNA